MKKSWSKMCQITQMFILLVVVTATTLKAECSPPPPGLWLIQAYEPVIPHKHPTLSGYIHLTIDENNEDVFIGVAQVRHETVPGLLTFSATGVFDYDACTLYGAYVLHISMVHDTYQWSYDGNTTMAGLYRPFMASVPQFPKHSMFVLHYQGPNSIRS